MLTYWKEVLGGAAVAMVIFFILDYSPYMVHGKVPVEKKVNELEWRIEDLEDAMCNR